jgi:hypothetical protein
MVPTKAPVLKFGVRATHLVNPTQTLAGLPARSLTVSTISPSPTVIVAISIKTLTVRALLWAAAPQTPLLILGGSRPPNPPLGGGLSPQTPAMFCGDAPPRPKKDPDEPYETFYFIDAQSKATTRPTKNSLQLEPSFPYAFSTTTKAVVARAWRDYSKGGRGRTWPMARPCTAHWILPECFRLPLLPVLRNR